MFSQPHNQNLLNDVMKILSGGDKPENNINPAPKWVVDASYGAAKTLSESFTSGQVVTSELKRDILRKHLAEAVKDCGCNVNKDDPIHFEKEVEKRMNEGIVPTAKLATPKEVAKKTAKPPTKGLPVNKGLASHKEQIEVDMREFLTHLTEEEIEVLSNVLNEAPATSSEIGSFFTQRTEVKIAHDPKDNQKLVATSKFGTFSFPKSLFIEFCKAYKSQGPRTGDKAHYSTHYPSDTTMEPSFHIGEAWQKMFLGKVVNKNNLEIAKGSPKKSLMYSEWLNAMMKAANTTAKEEIDVLSDVVIEATMSKSQLSKAVSATFTKFFNGVQVDMMAIPRLSKEIEAGLSAGKDAATFMPELVKKYRKN